MVNIPELVQYITWLAGNVKMPMDVSFTFSIEDKSVNEYEAKFRETYGWCGFCGEPYLSDAAESCSKCGK